MVGDALLGSCPSKALSERPFSCKPSLLLWVDKTIGRPYDASADITTQVAQSFESSLNHLHTDYVDSYVLHGPYSRGGLGAADWEVWAAIESIYKAGKAKMIGVSNVNAGQLRLLCEKSKNKAHGGTKSLLCHVWMG